MYRHDKCVCQWYAELCGVVVSRCRGVVGSWCRGVVVSRGRGPVHGAALAESVAQLASLYVGFNCALAAGAVIGAGTTSFPYQL